MGAVSALALVGSGGKSADGGRDCALCITDISRAIAALDEGRDCGVAALGVAAAALGCAAAVVTTGAAAAAAEADPTMGGCNSDGVATRPSTNDCAT